MVQGLFRREGPAGGEGLGEAGKADLLVRGISGFEHAVSVEEEAVPGRDGDFPCGERTGAEGGVQEDSRRRKGFDLSPLLPEKRRVAGVDVAQAAVRQEETEDQGGAAGGLEEVDAARRSRPTRSGSGLRRRAASRVERSMPATMAAETPCPTTSLIEKTIPVPSTQCAR